MQLSTKHIAEMSILLALSAVLEVVFMLFPSLPQGGSVSLSMLPIFVLTYRYGLGLGILAGGIFGLINFMLSGFQLYGVWQSFFLDYLFAFMVLGFSALAFRINKNSVVVFGLGIFVGSLARFLMHYVSGIVLFGEFAPEDQAVWLYSLLYNGSYMGASFLLSLVVGLALFKRLIFPMQQAL